MTLEEAEKVAMIVLTADGGCSVCVRSLANKLAKAFPEFSWVYDDTWELGKSETLTVRPVDAGQHGL